MIFKQEIFNELEAHPKAPPTGYVSLYSYAGSLWLQRSNGMKYDLMLGEFVLGHRMNDETAHLPVDSVDYGSFVRANETTGKWEYITLPEIFSILNGGTTGQALVKDTNADLDWSWQDVIIDLSFLNGGTTGQALIKDTNTDLDFSWKDIPNEVDISFLAGGTTGQIYRKDSNADFDASWYNPDYYTKTESDARYPILDVNGIIPESYLPAYISEIQEYANLAAFPTPGTSGVIYVALDSNKTYRWSGTQYTEISASLSLGETASTAYRGDRGAVAYAHSQIPAGTGVHISDQERINWNLAFSWGNHATQGYLKAITKAMVEAVLTGLITSHTHNYGTGSVTSVALTAPVGFAVTGSPITTAGTFQLNFAAGYSLPSNATQANWNTAYGWGNHATQGYLKSITKAMVEAVLTGEIITHTHDIRYLRSVGLTMPAAFSVTNTPVVPGAASSNLTVQMAAGYAVPQIIDMQNWSAAYSWGNHAVMGYLTGITKAMVEAVLTGVISSHSHPSTDYGYWRIYALDAPTHPVDPTGGETVYVLPTVTGTTYYIDFQAATNGNGLSSSSPWNNLPSSWSNNCKYLIKRGSTLTRTTALPVIASGTKVIIDVYGDPLAAKPVIYMDYQGTANMYFLNVNGSGMVANLKFLFGPGILTTGGFYTRAAVTGLRVTNHTGEFIAYQMDIIGGGMGMVGQSSSANSNKVTIAKCVIDQSWQDAIFLDKLLNWELGDCSIKGYNELYNYDTNQANSSGDGVQWQNSSTGVGTIKIHNNTFDRKGLGNKFCIILYNAAQNYTAEIYNNRMYSNMANTTHTPSSDPALRQAPSTSGIYLHPTTGQVKIYNNVFSWMQNYGIYAYVTNLKVYNNLFSDCGTGLSMPTNAAGASQGDIYNNVFHGCESWHLTRATGNTLNVLNNLFVYNAAYNGVCYNSMASTGWVINYNYYETSVRPTSTQTTLTAFRAAYTAYDTNSAQGNPMLQSGIYRPQAGSPLIHTGTTNVLVDVGDYSGELYTAPMSKGMYNDDTPPTTSGGSSGTYAYTNIESHEVVEFGGNVEVVVTKVGDRITINMNAPEAAGGSGLQLGETSITAYRGDRGKIAYDFSQAHPSLVVTQLDIDNFSNTPKHVTGSLLASLITGGNSGLQLGETSSTAYRGDRGKAAYDFSVSHGSLGAVTLESLTTPTPNGTPKHISTDTLLNWQDTWQYLTAITKSMVEAVLTGEITSHTHPGGGSNYVWVLQVNNGTPYIVYNNSTLNINAGANIQMLFNNGVLQISSALSVQSTDQTVKFMKVMTQTAYNNLGTKDGQTMYIIVG